MRPLVNDTLKVLERIITLVFPVVWLVAPLLAVIPVYAKPHHVVKGVW
jgi:hypothetical protein